MAYGFESRRAHYNLKKVGDIMGYLTGYNMTVRNINKQQLLKLNELLVRKEIIDYALEQGEITNTDEASFATRDCVKWYNYEIDIIEVSQQFPDCVFLLEGDGEDSLDYWREYFKNGEVEYCPGTLTYPEPQQIKW